MVDFRAGCLVAFTESFSEFADHFRRSAVCTPERIDIISRYKLVVPVGYGLGQLQQCESNPESGMVSKPRESPFPNTVRTHL